MKFLTSLCSRWSFFCFGHTSPLQYDLHLFAIPGTNNRTMICFHGYGANYRIAEDVKHLGFIDATLISFNFPDHDLLNRSYEPEKSAFGSIQELLPAFYVLKKCVLDKGLHAVDLYGFSAGGGALINLIAVLNTQTHDKELQQLGITLHEKKRLLEAIQNGLIVLDAPLKSVEEIIDGRGTSSELEILAKHYRDNHFRPIDSLKLLDGLSLNIILFFQSPDELIYNRDDNIYIERLKKANSRGSTQVIIADEGGHIAPHTSLWRLYSQKINSKR